MFRPLIISPRLLSDQSDNITAPVQRLTEHGFHLLIAFEWLVKGCVERAAETGEKEVPLVRRAYRTILTRGGALETNSQIINAKVVITRSLSNFINPLEATQTDS
ncbi:MAG: hypothetical protein L0220_08300 [Acidobacteria bacterium]|nr:hypothetical protein [Acidobacteriota bacterium]